MKLEEKLAQFFRKEGALTFSTGYQTNLGIISSLAGKDDVLVIDKLDHASIIDACRLSFAEIKKFKHNDMGSLEFVLKECGGHGKAGRRRRGLQHGRGHRAAPADRQGRADNTARG